MRRPDRPRLHAPLAVLLGAAAAVLAARAAPPVADLGVLVEARRQAWEAMRPPEQALFRQRLEAWKALSHDAAGLRRERYLALQALDGVDLALVRDARQRYAAMPPAQQAAYREQFAELDITVQRGWLLGPRLGADYTELSPLLLQVPPDQRQPLLDTLRDMSAEERHDLGVLAHRTPPQERDALRRALIETTRDNRAAWLQLRLSR